MARPIWQLSLESAVFILTDSSGLVFENLVNFVDERAKMRRLTLLSA